MLTTGTLLPIWVGYGVTVGVGYTTDAAGETTPATTGAEGCIGYCVGDAVTPVTTPGTTIVSPPPPVAAGVGVGCMVAGVGHIEADVAGVGYIEAEAAGWVG